MNLFQISPLLPVDGSYTYHSESDDYAMGDLVEIEFGRRPVAGIITEIGGEEATKTKSITKLIAAKILSSKDIEFIQFASWYNMAHFGSFLDLAISSLANIVQKSSLDGKDQIILTPLEPNSEEQAKQLQKYEIWRNIHEKISKIYEETGAAVPMEIVKTLCNSKSTLLSMIKHNLLTSETVKQKLFAHHLPAKNPSTLNIEQQSVFEEIYQNTIAQNAFGVHLLHGVTGSGKTEIYLNLANKYLSEKLETTVLILLPEIMLTSAIEQKIVKDLGLNPVVWHSDITPAQKKKNLQIIQNSSKLLVIGTRSALFLPYKNLSMIVVDEEHDGSYKQNEKPVYQARDMAIAKAKFFNIPILLCSATPSSETMSNVASGKYQISSLTTRHHGMDMPQIHILDMRKEQKQMDKGNFIAPFLKEKIKTHLASGHQALLFLNRRGFTSYLICNSCGEKVQCPNCDINLTWYKHDNLLRCNYCNYSMVKKNVCPSCKQDGVLVFYLPGIEKIQEEIKHAFPQAKIATVSSDDIAKLNRKEIVSLFDSLTSGNYDIIIGTQIIAKGYNFPKLKLVGVIDGDTSMNQIDFRTAERTFQLLTQVAGRAGRFEENAEVVLQSYNPEGKLIQTIAEYDFDEFCKINLNERHQAFLPPYTRQVALIFTSQNKELCEFYTKIICENLRAELIKESIKNVKILGPISAPIKYLKRQFRYRLLVVAARDVPIQNILHKILATQKLHRDMYLKIDVDPYYFH